MYVTYLASAFRSVRFGVNDAHGKGMVLQFNYLMDEGAFDFNSSTGRFAVNFGKIKNATQKLTGAVMTVQAEGSYEKAKALLDKYSLIRPEMKSVLDRLTDIPTDIAPTFLIAGQLK